LIIQVVLGVCWLPVAGQAEQGNPIVAALEAAAQALDRGEARRALDALEPVKAEEPDNPWYLFYAGRAQHMLNDPHAAIGYYDRALERLEAYAESDSSLANAIGIARREARREIFTFYLQSGLAYDSNVTFGGAGATATFISGREDGKFATRIAWDYAPVIRPDRSLTLSGRVASAWHFAVEEFNYQDYGTTVRYSQRLSDHWRFDLLYDYDFFALGNDSFLSTHGLSPRLSYLWTLQDRAFEPTETLFDYRLEAVDYLFDTEPVLDRDGFTNTVGLAQAFLLRPRRESAWACDLFVGYRFGSFATEGSEFDRWASNIFVGAAFPLKSLLRDRDLTFQFNADWEISDYWHSSVYDEDGDERDDLITTLGAILSQELIDDPRDGQLILHAIVGWSDADSNVHTEDGADPFTYDKLIAGFQLEWRF
jgi:hypothetical protein